DMQKEHDEEAEKLDAFFSVSAGGKHDHTADKKLKAALESSLGVMSHTTRRILSDELQLVQSAHEKLLISWQPCIADRVVGSGGVPQPTSTRPVYRSRTEPTLKRDCPRRSASL
ncbi:hypothetical protein PSHT_10182, partial [Puccinia striiformis]